MGWGGIAQHFNIFPNGKITTGRNINTTPVGITGWNTNKICIEIYGDFDNGKDIMKNDQRQAVIAVYAILCEKFSLIPSIYTIRPHAWFTSGGKYLGDYYVGKSRKTCPGTNFMGFGNTKAGFVNNFYPLVKTYMESRTVDNTNKKNTLEKVDLIGTVNTLDGSELNIRKNAGTSYKIIGSIPNKSKINITGKRTDGWFKVKYEGIDGYVNSKYITDIQNPNQVTEGKTIVRSLQTALNASYRCGLVVDGIYGNTTKSVLKQKYLKKGYKGGHVLWLQESLIDNGYNIVADGDFGTKTEEAVKSYQTSKKLTVDGIAGLDTHSSLVS